MKSKEALNIIEQRFKEGKTRGEIFSELSSKVKFRSDLLQYIAMVPDYDTRKKYKTLNSILFYLLILASTTSIINIFFFLLSSNLSILKSAALMAIMIPFSFTFVLLYGAVQVWKYRGNIYRILGGLGIANMFLRLQSYSDSNLSYNMIGIALELVLGVIPMILIVTLCYYIGNKVFPYYSSWGQLQEKKLNIQS
ncbi:MAG: hypothetical protein AB9866_22830 [Syntrophobacteraceae bacterium]